MAHTTNTLDSGAGVGFTASPIAAETLGAELARSVVERTPQQGDPVSSLAERLSLKPSRVARELGYLSAFTMRFCIDTVLKDDPVRPRVVAAFEDALWSGAPWGPHASGLARRAADYEEAFDNPHPEYGRSLRIGRAFAKWCHAREDVSVIELGARAYVEQLPFVLDLLRTTQDFVRRGGTIRPGRMDRGRGAVRRPAPPGHPRTRPAAGPPRRAAVRRRRTSSARASATRASRPTRRAGCVVRRSSSA